jgi:hypothetical protein
MKAKSAKYYTFKDAAFFVLSKARRPLRCSEILEKAQADGIIIQTQGKTPQNTLFSVLNKDIAASGDGSRFVKLGRGLYSVRTRG